MPWKCQTCPFCQKKYVNKTGLRNHLDWYTGEWRFPADGIHDVLSIDQILNPPDPDQQNQYRCPSCAKIINSRRAFMEHVVYRMHYGPYGDGSGHGDGKGDSGTTTTRSTGKRKRGYLETWILPFDEELVKVPQRKGPFAFLRLPFDIRQLIYKELLHYTQITIHKPTRPSTTGRERHGVCLQHNPHRNALAMLAVSRQTYEEGRRVFYGLNMFVFETLGAIPVFFIGIGRHNAMFLRSVKWGEEWGEWQEWIEVLRPFLVPVVVEEEGSDNGDYDDEKVEEGDGEENDEEENDEEENDEEENDEEENDEEENDEEENDEEENDEEENDEEENDEEENDEEENDEEENDEEEEEDNNSHEEDTTPPDPTIWTDEDTYLNLLRLLAAKPPTAMYTMYDSDRNRLLRFEDAGSFVSGDIRERHSMSVTLKKDTNTGSVINKCVVSFELLERKSKESRLPWSVRSSYEYYKARQKGECLATNSNRSTADKN